MRSDIVRTVPSLSSGRAGLAVSTVPGCRAHCPQTWEFHPPTSMDADVRVLEDADSLWGSPLFSYRTPKPVQMGVPELVVLK